MKTYDERIKSLMVRIDKLAGQNALKVDKETKARQAAIGATIDAWLADLPEAQRIKFFAGIEPKAAPKHLRLIERHPNRPETTPKVAAKPTQDTSN